MAAWGAWYEELGAATVDPGAPVGKSHTVSAAGHVEDGGANPVSGYTIVDMPDYAAACAAAAPVGLAIQCLSEAVYVDSASSCLAAVWHRHSWRLGLMRSHTRRAVWEVRWRKRRRRSARAAAV